DLLLAARAAREHDPVDPPFGDPAAHGGVVVATAQGEAAEHEPERLLLERLLDARQHLREPRALARLDDDTEAPLAPHLEVARGTRGGGRGAGPAAPLPPACPRAGPGVPAVEDARHGAERHVGALGDLDDGGFPLDGEPPHPFLSENVSKNVSTSPDRPRIDQ